MVYLKWYITLAALFKPTRLDMEPTQPATPLSPALGMNHRGDPSPERSRSFPGWPWLRTSIASPGYPGRLLGDWNGSVRGKNTKMETKSEKKIAKLKNNQKKNKKRNKECLRNFKKHEQTETKKRTMSKFAKPSEESLDRLKFKVYQYNIFDH